MIADESALGALGFPLLNGEQCLANYLVHPIEIESIEANAYKCAEPNDALWNAAQLHCLNFCPGQRQKVPCQIYIAATIQTHCTPNKHDLQGP